MLESICTFIVYMFSPVVRKVIRKSLMGHYFDKTIEYYIGTMKLSITDEHHSIEFSHKNQNYIVVCEEEGVYEHIISYIGRTEFDCNENSGILAAFEEEEEGGTYKNITDLVLKYQGPEKNFYNNTTFPVKKRHITDGILYVIDSKLKVYRLEEDDAVISLGTSIDLKEFSY